MKRTASEDSERSLFDPPLDRSAEQQSELPLQPEPDKSPGTDGQFLPVGSSRKATRGERLSAGLLDLAAHIGGLILAILGSWWLNVPPSKLSAAPLVLFILAFSFVYHVVPLTFWGHTPGMTGIGLVARGRDGGPLTIAQAIRRWLGVILSVVTLGIAVLVSGSRSPADRLSQSSIRY